MTAATLQMIVPMFIMGTVLLAFAIFTIAATNGRQAVNAVPVAEDPGTPERVKVAQAWVNDRIVRVSELLFKNGKRAFEEQEVAPNGKEVPSPPTIREAGTMDFDDALNRVLGIKPKEWELALRKARGPMATRRLRALPPPKAHPVEPSRQAG